jgi:hypothetical protein
MDDMHNIFHRSDAWAWSVRFHVPENDGKTWVKRLALQTEGLLSMSERYARQTIWKLLEDVLQHCKQKDRK